MASAPLQDDDSGDQGRTGRTWLPGTRRCVSGGGTWASVSSSLGRACLPSAAQMAQKARSARITHYSTSLVWPPESEIPRRRSTRSPGALSIIPSSPNARRAAVSTWSRWERLFMGTGRGRRPPRSARDPCGFGTGSSLLWYPPVGGAT